MDGMDDYRPLISHLGHLNSQDTKPRTLQDARDDMESHLVSSFLPD